MSDPGSLALTGSTAQLNVVRRLLAAPGALAFTGGEATFDVGMVNELDSQPGALALAGGTATFRLDRKLAASPGTLELVGGEATLEGPAIARLGGGVPSWMLQFGRRVRCAVPEREPEVERSLLYTAVSRGRAGVTAVTW